MSVQASLVLYVIIVASRATSLLFSKCLLTDMGPFNLLALRFLAAFAVLALIFLGKLRHMNARTLLHGVMLGGAFFATMSLELCALRITASSTVSFLENCAIVIVPLATAVLSRKLPSPTVIASALVTMVGVWFITAGSGLSGFGPGEALALGAALAYTCAILLTARFSREDDPLTLGIVQVGTIGLLGAIATPLVETPTLPSSPVQWGALVALVVVCSGFGFTLQPLAQRRIPAEKAGLLCAVSPLVAGTLGILVLGEPCGPTTLAGMALVAGGITLANVNGERLASLTKRFATVLKTAHQQ